MGEIIRRRELIAGVIDLNKKGSMAVISDYTYTGSQITPTPTITCNGKTLTAGTDFTYSYGTNIDAGTGTVIATGTGKKYKGSITGNFTINQATGYITLNSTSAGSCAWNSSSTRTVTSSHGGTLSVSSSNTTTCTASVSGSTITITGANYNSGTASTITVTCAATTNYTAASATFSWTCTRTAGSITLSTSSMSISSGAYKFRHYGNEIEYITPPTVTSNLTYNGQSQAPTISSYYSDKMTVGGKESATDARSYQITFTPKDGYEWDDSTGTATKSYDWSIAKAAGTLSISPTSVSFTSSGKTANITVTSNCLGTISISSLNGDIINLISPYFLRNIRKLY